MYVTRAFIVSGCSKKGVVGVIYVLKSKSLLHRILSFILVKLFSSVVSFKPSLFCCCVIDSEHLQVLAYKKRESLTPFYSSKLASFTFSSCRVTKYR